MQARDIIDEALKQAHPHISPQGTAKGVLLSALSALDEQVVQEISQIYPNMLEYQVDTLSVTAAKNQNGYPLKDSPTYRDFKLIQADDYVRPIRLVLRHDLDDPGGHPGGAVAQGTYSSVFLPSDPKRERWEGTEEREFYKTGEKISYLYIPQTVQLDSLSDTLASPQVARPYLIAGTVLDILLREEGVPPQRLAAAVQRMERARQTFTMQVWKQVIPSPSPPRDYS